MGANRRYSLTAAVCSTSILPTPPAKSNTLAELEAEIAELQRKFRGLSWRAALNMVNAEKVERDLERRNRALMQQQDPMKKPQRQMTAYAQKVQRLRAEVREIKKAKMAAGTWGKPHVRVKLPREIAAAR